MALTDIPSDDHPRMLIWLLTSLILIVFSMFSKLRGKARTSAMMAASVATVGSYIAISVYTKTWNPLEWDGLSLIGGCAGTQFGCCDDSTTSKVDASGSNCLLGPGTSVLPPPGCMISIQGPPGHPRKIIKFQACLQDLQKSEKVCPRSPKDTKMLAKSLPQDTKSENKWKE